MGANERPAVVEVMKEFHHPTAGFDRLLPNEIKTIYLNMAASSFIGLHLDDAGEVIEATLNHQGYGSDHFKKMRDPLVLKPNGLSEIISRLQKALSKVE